MTGKPRTKADDLTIYVQGEMLSDGSKVWNVLLGDNVFHAYDEDHANTLAETLVDAINKHTCDLVGEVHYG